MSKDLWNGNEMDEVFASMKASLAFKLESSCGCQDKSILGLSLAEGRDTAIAKLDLREAYSLE
jgi:hypothetical protein